MSQLLNTKSQKTYDQVFEQPMPIDLEWRDLRSLFEELGRVQDEPNGNVKVTLGEQTAVFRSPNDNDNASPEQIGVIRKLLHGMKREAGTSEGPHLILVLDHKEARIYEAEMKGTVPEKVSPKTTGGQSGKLHNHHDNSEVNPNFGAYYKAVAAELDGAGEFLVFGSGTGPSSAKDGFVAWLKDHRKDLLENLAGVETVDLSHLTDAEILAKAREIYSR